jgi:aminoglycoside phosphotransferase family enzyme/predicted kinase
MIRQAEIFQAMEKPEFYPHPVTRIKIRETHISMVFLTGAYVYKIKKAINLEFLDYTSLSKRKFYCLQETALNRRLSDDVYLGVVAITRKNGCYFLNGPGDVVEYAVKMRQLPEQRSLVRLLRRAKIDQKAISQIALKLSKFYEHAPIGGKTSAYGTWETIRTNCEENSRQSEPFAGTVIDDRMFRVVRAATCSFLNRRKVLFEQRVNRGKIRDCHGDLRSGHIYLTDGIQIIDCIEFNERYRYSDITSDLAFLAMDLDYEGFPNAAQHLLDCYVRYADDPDVFVLIDFYKCYRALVRAKVNCLRLANGALGQPQKKRLLKETDRYLNLAYKYAILFTRPTMWVICGMVACGKSTIAKKLSEITNIGVLHSDLIRKDLFGMKSEDVMDVPFEVGIYSKGASSLAYGKLLLLAQEKIEKGSSVILDATFSKRRQRREALRLAEDMDANIVFIECIAPVRVIEARLLKREDDACVSDARLHHVKQLMSQFEPFQDIADQTHIRIDTQKPVKENMTKILSYDYSLFLKDICGVSSVNT